MMLPDITQHFLNSIQGEVADATWTQYRFALALMQPIQRALEQIALNDLRSLRANLLDRYAPTSINMFQRVWRVFFNWCIDEGLIEHSPCARLRPLKEPDTMKAANIKDVALMIETATAQRHLRDAAIMLLMLSTGCRVGAVCRLRLDAIDHERRTAELVEKGGQIHPVNLVDRAYMAVCDYIDYERPANLANPLLFVSYRNGENGLTANAVLYMLRRYADELHITTPHNPHSIRHLFTITMLKQGAALDVVSKLLGHSSTAITERYYARYSADALRTAHARFNPIEAL